MRLKIIIPVAVVVIAIGVFTSSYMELFSSDSESNNIERIPLDSETLSNFPRPMHPPASILSNGITLEEAKQRFPLAEDMPEQLPNGKSFFRRYTTLTMTS